MLSQTKNSLELYRGAAPSQIKKALSFQRSDVVDELKELCHTKDYDELAIKLSAGIY